MGVEIPWLGLEILVSLPLGNRTSQASLSTPGRVLEKSQNHAVAGRRMPFASPCLVMGPWINATLSEADGTMTNLIEDL